MKILELCPYTAGICGVFSRAYEEAWRLADKGYEIRFFSSNIEKGTDKTVPSSAKIGKISIQRFNALKPGKYPLHFLPGGESYMFWNFFKEGLEYSPDIIITHNYRHFHNNLALMLANKLRKQGKPCKVFLVTHAPFPEGDITRTFWGHAASWFYDFFIGRREINKYNMVLTISKWEVPYLKKVGIKANKIKYIPNGIPEEFFTQKKLKESNKILFLGRIAPKKKLETLIEAVPYIKDKKVEIEIVGPKEKEYFSKLDSLIKKLKLEKRITVSEPVYDLKDKIKKIDSCKIYVLPSRVEGMPQSLIKAMAREKVVIGSDSKAIRDLIKNGKNGYLFKFDDPKSLAETIDKALSTRTGIPKDAKKSVEGFAWSKVIKEIEKTITER